MAPVPDQIPVLVDAKVGDIGNTAEQYARKFFDVLDADALTVTPYMGTDAVTPFTAYKDCTTFLVCLTSNPGADDFEKQPMGDRPSGDRARKIHHLPELQGRCRRFSS